MFLKGFDWLGGQDISTVDFVFPRTRVVTVDDNQAHKSALSGFAFFFFYMDESHCGEPLDEAEGEAPSDGVVGTCWRGAGFHSDGPFSATAHLRWRHRSTSNEGT